MTRPVLGPGFALPHRQPLAFQAASILREQIAAGAWQGRLPGERRLCSLLQVSRNTIRSALVQLQAAGVIAAEASVGHRIVSASAGPALRFRDVAFLSPTPLEELQPRQTLWIDGLRALLGERGYRLRVFHGGQYFRRNPGSVLRKLVEGEPHGCWILNMATPSVQAWFCRNRVPSVVAGSAHAGIGLPFSDFDHRAVCRHAVGVFLRLGHSRIAFFSFKSSRAGELESVEGYTEGIRHASRGDLEPIVVHHDGTHASICQKLDWLLRMKAPPTAILVANASYFLAVMTRLAQLGLRTPRDISLISRDESSFLNFVMPCPARYVADPNAFAKNLLRPVLDVLKGGFGAGRGRFIMPEFIRGDSLGPPSVAPS